MPAPSKCFVNSPLQASNLLVRKCCGIFVVRSIDYCCERQLSGLLQPLVRGNKTHERNTNSFFELRPLAVPASSAFAVPASSAFAVPASSAARRPVVRLRQPGRPVDAKKNRFAIFFGVNKPLMANGGLRRTAARSTPKKIASRFFLA